MVFGDNSKVLRGGVMMVGMKRDGSGARHAMT